MNTKTLTEFQAVYENQSIHKAARQLFITPQGLGKNIRQLEEELHTQLFERTKQGFCLQPADGFFIKSQQIFCVS